MRCYNSGMSYAYTNKTAVQNYTLTNIDASFDTQLNAWIAAMSEYIDQEAGYPVYREEETTRLYDGNGTNSLIISPVNTITEVVVDEVVVTPHKYPYNDDTKYELILSSGCFACNIANVSVTGIHCLKKDLPESIKWACTVFVAAIVNQSNNQTDGVASEKIGDYQVSFKSEKDRADFVRAKEIVTGLRRISF